MRHKIATILSILLIFHSGTKTIFFGKFVGNSYELFGRSATVYGFALVILAIVWFVSWYTKAFDFTKDENWPYLLISTYLLVIIVKMVS